MWCSKVRKGQLEKEARELRAENAVLQEHVEQAKHAAQSGEKVRILHLDWPSSTAGVSSVALGKHWYLQRKILPFLQALHPSEHHMAF